MTKTTDDGASSTCSTTCSASRYSCSYAYQLLWAAPSNAGGLGVLSRVQISELLVRAEADPVDLARRLVRHMYVGSEHPGASATLCSLGFAMPEGQSTIDRDDCSTCDSDCDEDTLPRSAVRDAVIDSALAKLTRQDISALMVDMELDRYLD